MGSKIGIINEVWRTFAAISIDHITRESREDMIKAGNAVEPLQALWTAIHHFSLLGYKRLKTISALTREERSERFSSLPM